MDLERELRGLRVEWPATPAFALPLERRRRWPLALAIALAAVAVAFAVPQSRGAILRFFDVGAVHVELVDTLPPAKEAPLDQGLGPVVSAGVARRTIGQLLVPPLDPPPPLHRALGGSISTVFEYRGHPVLLTEFGSGFYQKKLVGGQTSLVSVSVRGMDGLWLSGARHDYFTNRSPRLAGNVLLWATDRVTYRIEGPSLSRADALALADSLRRG